MYWRILNYTYKFGCQARETHRWLLEYRWVSRLVRSLDRFHTIYSIGRKTSWRIYVVRVEINKKTAYIQARSSMARALEVNGKARQAEGEAKSGLMKSSILKTHENCEGSLSLTRRIRNSKKPSRTRVRSWNHQWLLLCLARQARHVSMGRPVAKPMRSNQNLRVSWKPVSPQDCVWKNLYRIIMRTILQERGAIHCNITIWYTNLFSCLKHEDSRSKSSSG